MNPLTPYASRPDQSRGRRYPLSPDPHRNEFQRDRDRIVHSTAFRRLVYKTQVFLNHEGDLFRTRMTHTLEVAQMARSLARRLGLHEDLCEAISLAHDLGHTPFGHAGQDALDEAYRAAAPEAGGFEHNLQSLRVVDVLEERYPDHPGLNLCFETREGILKHCSKKNAEKLGDVGRRFLEGQQPSLEAQITNLADEIAYNNHDIDDGLRAHLFTIGDLDSVPFAGGIVREVRADMNTNAQGATGFNPPALVGMMVGAPYLHAGNARTLEEAFSNTFAAHHQASALIMSDAFRQLSPRLDMESQLTCVYIQQRLMELHRDTFTNMVAELLAQMRPESPVRDISDANLSVLEAAQLSDHCNRRAAALILQWHDANDSLQEVESAWRGLSASAGRDER